PVAVRLGAWAAVQRRQPAGGPVPALRADDRVVPLPAVHDLGPDQDLRAPVLRERVGADALRLVHRLLRDLLPDLQRGAGLPGGGGARRAVRRPAPSVRLGTGVTLRPGMGAAAQRPAGEGGLLPVFLLPAGLPGGPVSALAVL